MVKFLRNRRGNAFIWMIIFIFIFIGISTLVIDYGNLYVKTKKIKYTMNRAVKAASLQIKEDGEELANGVFEIDEVKADEAFKEVLAGDLGLSETTLEPKSNSLLYATPIIKEFEVINDTSTSYTSPIINQVYNIENPGVIATLEFQIKSTFLVTDIQVSKLSGSQLTSVYD
ncbi:hypothetical protein [Sedimentibacter sp. MB31-C6]|uniref:hypothetical protein n=1 Tax=Sedimentibacter sp. MB31-C6 TaxID=3109366 RepID=UPI002DDCEB31|nr:hypothetical protein [Sedimentibacter sp. MB36-C1]WSI05125.1 hypothetical protein U8307_04860 [Sedimentibacter sp. MB36-C1]